MELPSPVAPEPRRAQAPVPIVAPFAPGEPEQSHWVNPGFQSLKEHPGSLNPSKPLE